MKDQVVVVVVLLLVLLLGLRVKVVAYWCPESYLRTLLGKHCIRCIWCIRCIR